MYADRLYPVTGRARSVVFSELPIFLALFV